MQYVDIWLGGLPNDEAILKSYAKLLDEGEQARAEAFANPVVRGRFIAVRGLLRQVLSQYLDVTPAGLQFASGEFGKPALVGHNLHFNLSHSEDRLAIAVSGLENVGIDIEQIKPRNSLSELANRCFSAAEFAVWSALPDTRQQQVFFQLWTKKEAFVKAVGRGIALGLDQCEIKMPLGLEFEKIPQAYGSAGDWKIVELSPDAGFCGALVAPNVEFAIRECRLE